MIRTLRLLLFLAVLPVATGGCAGSVAHWIARTRDHQGDVALAHRNYADASVAYRLALDIDPRDAHARDGFVNVQLRLAENDFAASKFDEALDALALAAKYSPNDDRVQTVRNQIEQAEIKREIVISNYPSYRVSGRALERAYAQLGTQTQVIARALRRFDYTYDTADLSTAIRDSYALGADVTRLTNRLIGYRQLVESGIPESGGETLAPPASLLPLP